MKHWPVQDAKARFSELLETCLREGPQVVTKRGSETAVLSPARGMEAPPRLRSPNAEGVAPSAGACVPKYPVPPPGQSAAAPTRCFRVTWPTFSTPTSSPSCAGEDRIQLCSRG